MYRAQRAFLILLLVTASLVLPWGPAAADPERGRGRQDAPGQRDRQPSEEEESSEGEDPAEEQNPGNEQEPGEHGQSEQNAGEPPPEERQQPPSQGANEGAAQGPGASATGPTLSVSASPSSVRVGDVASVLVTVRAPEDTPIHEAEILADLPSNLVFRSASRIVEVDGELIRVPLSGVREGNEVSVSLVIEATASPIGAQQPVRIALTADEMVLRDEVTIQVQDESEGALALSQSSPLLVQVGDTGSFSMTLHNPSTEPAEDVVVVAEIAPELDVVGVTPLDEANAIQLGRSRTAEDIVWLFESVAPGDEIELTWRAQAVVAGDLEAETSARVSAEGGFATGTRQTTYLGLVRGVRTEAGEPAGQVLRERVVTKLVPVTREVNASAAGLLPVTGATPGAVVLLGTMLIMSGGALLLAAHARPSRRVLAVAVLAGLLTMSACVSDDDTTPPAIEDAGSEDPADADDDEVAPQPDEGDEPEDRVLGVRIERDRVPGAEETGAVGSETVTTVAETAAPAATETVFEEVETTTLVLVPEAEQPTERLGSRSGDNVGSLSISASGDPTVTSSRMITSDATEELLVSAGGSRDAITSSVTLRNLAQRRLEVRGVLVLSIASGTGSASELTSRPVDVILEPGGETSADFSFLLPAGEYSLRGAFRAY